MILAHISDLHLCAGTPETPLLRADANHRVKALMAHLAAYRPAIDLVAISGDLCDTGTPDDYAMLRAMLNRLPMPWVIIPGNHDRRAPFRAAFADLPFADPEVLNYECRAAGMRVLAVDSTVPGAPHGRLGPQDLAWIEARLAEPFDGPTFLMLHQPPVPARMGIADKAVLIEGAGELRDLLDAQSRPVTVLCGHMHRPFEARFGHASVFAAGSTAFEFDFVPDTAQEPGVTDTPFSYQLHFLGPDGQERGEHVVHRITPAL